jgi:hypothetical protein
MLILFEDGVCEDVEAGSAGEARFLLLQTPLASSTTARRGDLVELQAEGTIWRFVRVVQPASHVTIELAVPKDDGDWGALRTLFDTLEQVGGEWERAYGGLVLLHVPAAHAEEIRAKVDALLAGP